ncbi:GyrI-like domain-containing protein [Algibacter miyuki]|uniref:GyrI-like domain-containing protein n=1 Tax=Algibacter miyuki TaxID=1306933 RepID=A0ABV5H1R8_9FLAO|nr:GyrI-like domain-containing protein [Algibacter miyuki]MDN3666445.1 GyrI-like domain-containing protein [Algibacter miyuki]
MKTFKYILFLLLISIIGTAIYIAVQPNEFSFSKSRIIAAPTSIIFNEVNDYKNWTEFSPWLEQEPTATLTYLDPSSGVNSGYTWHGDLLGQGSMTTLNVIENKNISQKLNFITPYESEADVEWTFESQNEGTKVTWIMSGKQDFMTKMYTAFNGPMEDMVGPDFERGLFKLDSVTVASMKKYSIKNTGITTHGGGYYLYNTASCKISELPVQIQKTLPKLGQYAAKNQIQIAGSPFIIYHNWDDENNAVMFSYCIPTTEKIVSEESDVLTGQLQPFRAVKTVLTGNYSNLKEAWEKAMSYIPENGLNVLEGGTTLEIYRNDPAKTPNPADWITEIYIAITPIEE